MQIVIEIDDELAIKDRFYTDEEIWAIVNAVQHGTPMNEYCIVCALMDKGDKNVFSESKRD